MSPTLVEVRGTLQPDGTLVLDEKPNLPPGRVRVMVQAMAEGPAPAKESLVEFVRRVRREAEASGERFMTSEELQAWLQELRGDDDRIEEAYRLMEEEARRQGRQE
jgi:hypothetical protein